MSAPFVSDDGLVVLMVTRHVARRPSLRRQSAWALRAIVATVAPRTDLRRRALRTRRAHYQSARCLRRLVRLCEHALRDSPWLARRV